MATEVYLKKRWMSWGERSYNKSSYCCNQREINSSSTSPMITNKAISLFWKETGRRSASFRHRKVHYQMQFGWDKKKEKLKHLWNQNLLRVLNVQLSSVTNWELLRLESWKIMSNRIEFRKSSHSNKDWM